MSTGFNWFKSYKIHIHKGTAMFDYDDSDIEYIGGGSTSHSGYNIGLVQDLIEKYSGKRIPIIQGKNKTTFHFLPPKWKSDVYWHLIAYTCKSNIEYSNC